MTSRQSARAACIAVATSLLGIFAAPHMASAAAVTITVTDSGGTAIPRAFIAVVNSDGDAVDSAITGADGTASISDTNAAGLIVSAPGYQNKTSSTVTAQTVALTATTKTKLSYSNAFGGQVRPGGLDADGESGVFYATTDALPSVWRTSDYGGSWVPVPTSADTDTGGMAQSTADDLVTSGKPGEVAVISNNTLYFSRNYGNSWTAVSGYQQAVGNADQQSRQNFWVHGGASGEYSYFIVRTNTDLLLAILPDSVTDTGSVVFQSIKSTLGVYTAGDNVAFAVASNGDIFMATSNATATAISKLTTLSATVAGDIRATVSGPQPTATLATGGLMLLSTLEQTTPQAILLHSGSTLKVGAVTGGAWAMSLSTMKNFGQKGQDGQAMSSTDITSLTSGVCGSNGTASLVASLAPELPGTGEVLENAEAIGTIGQCAFVYNAGGTDPTVSSALADQTIALMEMSGANNNTGFAWDSGYDWNTNMVSITGDGDFGLRKSSFVSSASACTPTRNSFYRPFFGSSGGNTQASAFIDSQAQGGTGQCTGGIAVTGMSAPNITDMVYSPNSTDGQLLVTSMTESGGSRTLLSTDGGTSFSTLGAEGSRSVEWWNGDGTTQHIAATYDNGTNYLQIKSFNTTSGTGALEMGDELAANASTRDGTDSNKKPFTFGNAAQPSSGTLSSANFVKGFSQTENTAIEGIAGFNKFLVAVNGCSANLGPTGCTSSAGTVGLVSFTVNANTGAQTISESRFFGADIAAAGTTVSATTNFGGTKTSTYAGAVTAIRYCPTSAIDRVKDTAFVAVKTLGIYKITGLSGSSPTHSGPVTSGSYSDLDVDCDTGLVLAAGTDGAYFSLNGTDFTKVNTASAAPQPQPGGGGGAPTAVALQADATTGEVVMAVASGSGDIKAIETNFTVLGTTGSDMIKDGSGPKTPAAAVTPPTDSVNTVNDTTQGRNTGSVEDLEVPPTSTDKVNKAGVRVFSVRAMATSLSLAAGTGGGAFKARVNSGGSSTSSGGSSSGGSTATTTPTATTVTPVVVKTPTVVRGKTLTVVSALTTAGTTVVKGSKTSVVVATASKKICSATSTTIKGLVAGTCSLTVTVTPAKVTKTTNTTVTKGQSLTIASIASTNKLPSTTNATVAVTVSAGSKRVCTVSANKTVKAIGSGKCTLTISVTGKKFTKKLLVKVS